MSNKAISNLEKLDDILDSDYLIIIKQDKLHKILFSDFKLNPGNFFGAKEIIDKAQSGIDYLVGEALQKIAPVEMLSDSSTLSVSTNSYIIIDSTVKYDDTRMFIYSSTDSCFVPLDTLDYIKPEWFGIRPNESDNSEQLP